MIESDDQFSEEETARRAEAVLKRMLETPPKPRKTANPDAPTKAPKRRAKAR